ncbi:unnamed protein product [Ceutorhynchus assimilis]|uniref:Uncharacterized protein n=1 Tax=Ceutorhynchus assimilis TaxID=467358 RepID=A0A9N9MMC5_9CUCU|nr:unnamed protein product [Ceutorhynchus assimilis]
MLFVSRRLSIKERSYLPYILFLADITFCAIFHKGIFTLTLLFTYLLDLKIDIYIVINLLNNIPISYSQSVNLFLLERQNRDRKGYNSSTNDEIICSNFVAIRCQFYY